MTLFLTHTPIIRLQPRPLAVAVHRACAALVGGGLFALPIAQAQPEPSPATETTLPAVTVVASPVPAADPLVTQIRPAAVGKSRISVQDTPFSISIVDAAQVREAGAKNVQDALLYSAGVYAGRYGFDTRGDWSAVRGLTPSAYLDGLRGAYGFYNNVRPEIYTMERVEVLKGPSSVLYGQSDLGGIVNVVSKRPQKTAAREVELQWGMYDRKQIATDLTGPLNEDQSLLFRLVALKRDSGTQVEHVEDDALVLMPALTWQPNADTKVTLQFTHQQNDSQVSAQFLPAKGTLDPAPLGRIPTDRFVGEPGWDRYDTRKNEIGLFWDQQLAPVWKLSASVRKTHSASETREHYTTVGAVPDDAGNMTRTVHAADRKTDVLASDVRVEGVVNLGPTRHTVAVGIDYQDVLWEEYNYISAATGGGMINVYNPVYGLVNTAALTFSDRPDNKIVQTGIYLMDHIEWGPWLLSTALRRDRARNTVLNIGASDTVVRNSATTWRVGLMYRFANGLAPYISKATAFSPNLGTDGTGSANYLKPTTGEQKEAGVKYLSESGNTSAALAWFDIKQKDRIADGATPGGVEQVGARTDGWELELRHRMGGLELMANYMNLHAVNERTGQPLSSVPDKTASAWAQYRVGAWRVGLGARYVGSVTGNAGNPVVPSVTLYDAMLGYAVGTWDLRLNLQNVADKEYVSWCRGRNQDCGYGERRNAVLTANYRF
ncbi:TonB-dependent siderophore receptor [Chitiniphilus purpureus]|uniref:TonB-dependent siderophore receptor n=1 Tax=Chitiniphilus purpureus TaxID=2981137 RepID=A0ABY6DR66_9NEIS|nr:TonB-dependent siderophore receptor [Chitiniphilus sp. CD1]UXY16857.1 TonB-dependent siderophore receptor [Chitiniphilus sp. CD1]